MLSFKKTTSQISNSIKTHLQDKYKIVISPSERFHFRKRAVLFTFQKTGALTVEAAVVLPLFFLAVMGVLSFVQVLLVQMRIMGPLSNTARACAQYVYVQELGNEDEGVLAQVPDLLLEKKLSVIGARNDVVNQVGKEWLDACGIVRGASGLSFLFSQIPSKENMVDLVVHYRVQPDIWLIPIPSIPITQRCRVHGWVGSEATGAIKEKSQTVYVTDTGTVYHKSLGCTHIHLSILQVYTKDVATLRNESGGKYDSCENCGERESSIVYITNTGNRYHTSLSCRGIKRGVKKITMDEVGTRSACKRCGG